MNQLAIFNCRRFLSANLMLNVMDYINLTTVLFSIWPQTRSASGGKIFAVGHRP